MAGWVLATALWLVLPVQGTLGAPPPRDYDIPGGHYYEQGVRPDISDNLGFVVVDDEEAALWGELQRLGGVGVLGYPISQRYDCDGAICQAYQSAVLKWHADAGEAELLSVFDWLHLIGRDDWLHRVWGVPPWVRPADSPGGEAEDGENSFDLLAANPVLEEAYGRLGAASPSVYGAPRAYQESDKAAVLRTQRAVLVQPRDSRGQVGFLPAGEVFRDAGLIPPAALVPVLAPEPVNVSLPLHVKVAALGIDAAVAPFEMGPEGMLPVPDDAHTVAWYNYSARLGEGGNLVLAGHVDWNGESGSFWSLDQAQPGQLITLEGDNGGRFTYRIEWADTYPAESPAGLAALGPSSGPPTLTLVTCSGRFDFATSSYEERRIVRATLDAVEVPMEEPAPSE